MPELSISGEQITITRRAWKSGQFAHGRRKGSTPGHPIAALRAVKSSLWATAGGKGPRNPPEHDVLSQAPLETRVYRFAIASVGTLLERLHSDKMEL